MPSQHNVPIGLATSKLLHCCSRREQKAMMTEKLRILVGLALLVTMAQAFVIGPYSWDECSARRLTNSRIMMTEVALVAEPEGGTEMTSSTSIPGCRMKEMRELAEVKSDDGPVFEFWMTAEAEGALIKEIRTQILKDASKKANFPGFRKGQVPPYAQPQITHFAVQEGIIKTVQAAVDAYGLKSLAGSDGEVNVHEDVEAIAKGYKVGDSIQFTATLNAAYDPGKSKQTTDDTDSSDSEEEA